MITFLKCGDLEQLNKTIKYGGGCPLPPPGSTLAVIWWMSWAQGQSRMFESASHDLVSETKLWLLKNSLLGVPPLALVLIFYPSAAAETAPPNFTQRLQSMTVRQGSQVRLQVRVTGIPAPVVRFYRDGAEIQSSLDFQISQEGELYSLLIAEAYPEDSGTYSVNATNSVGRATSTAELLVQGMPRRSRNRRRERGHLGPSGTRGPPASPLRSWNTVSWNQSWLSNTHEKEEFRITEAICNF